MAERSQKDPKEYLPFLNELKKHTPPAYRRYKIDLHLKRYKDALQNLSEIHDEHREELLELIQAHRLYKEALKHLPAASQVRVNISQPSFLLSSIPSNSMPPPLQTQKEVCGAYGDYLVAKKYYEDAAMIYERGALQAEAVAAWEKSLNWRMCLTAAQAGNKMTASELRLDYFEVSSTRRTIPRPVTLV